MVKRMHLFWVFVVLAVFNSGVLTLFQSYLIIKVSSGEFDVFRFYLGTILITPHLDLCVMYPLSALLTKRLSATFLMKHLEKYYNISPESKFELSFIKFNDAMDSGKNAIVTIITWGLGTVINLSSSFINLSLMVYSKSLIKEFVAVIIAFGLFNYYILSKLRIRFSKYVKKEQDKRRDTRELIQLKGPSFQHRYDSVIDMFSLYNIIEITNYNSAKSWNMIGCINKLFLSYVSFLYMFYTIHDANTFLLISMAINNLTGSLDAFNQFHTAYERVKIDYTSLIDMYRDTTNAPDPERQNIGNSSFHIKKVEVMRGKYKISLASSFVDFVLKAGIKILIEGPTGMGKSTILKAIFGQLNNADVEIISSLGEQVQGSSLYRTVADYYQEIKERMPTSRITLRNFFKNEQDNDVIRQYLLYAWGEKEHDRIITSIKSKNSDIEDNMHPYDMPIREVLSGGQKNRLILWRIAYNVDQNDLEIIILDEPINDVDFDKYIQQLNAFFTRYSDKIIFMVGHLCNCKRTSLDIKFDMEIYVNNGLISRKC
jgi:ABC-type Mn2+/Zn2+ transport system ATPase subunit